MGHRKKGHKDNGTKVSRNPWTKGQRGKKKHWSVVLHLRDMYVLVFKQIKCGEKQHWLHPWGVCRHTWHTIEIFPRNRGNYLFDTFLHIWNIISLDIKDLIFYEMLYFIHFLMRGKPGYGVKMLNTSLSAKTMSHTGSNSCIHSLTKTLKICLEFH